MKGKEKKLKHQHDHESMLLISGYCVINNGDLNAKKIDFIFLCIF